MFTSNTNSSVCESLWENCDESIFSDIYDVNITEQNIIDKIEEVKDSDTTLIPENAESTMKRKYCATQSDRTYQGDVEESKKIMLKKMKNNSLFKF